MRNRIAILAGLIVILAMMFAACGPKPISKESILDTPDNHYRQGNRELQAGNLQDAHREFERASQLDPDYPGAYVGMGMIALEKKDYEAAFQLIDKGLGKDKTFVDGHIAKGAVYMKQRKGDDWLKKSLKCFDDALKIKPDSEKAIFYKGMANKNAYMFAEAAAEFRKVIELKGEFSQQANDQWELMQKIQRAAPGTRIGMQIALIPKIDRADLSVLFIEELKLHELLKKKVKKTYDTSFRPPDDPTAMPEAAAEKQPAATDIAGHWAKNWIEDIIETGIIEVYPDHTFQPDELITRAGYAMFIQNILIAVTGDQSLASKYFGSESPFPDVNPNHFAFNAISVCVSRGIMKADTMDGAFHMKDPVSGADALLIIRELQNALRMTF
ncbi:S-layer homology domain-containing protein [bacterium]|nr:S-layer homology domain-containing protein [bacterium]